MSTLPSRFNTFVKISENLDPPLKEAKTGSFWHWRRVYVLKGDKGKVYVAQLNIFERIYAHAVAGGIESYLKRTFPNVSIEKLLDEKEIDILIYNVFGLMVKNQKENSQSCLDTIYQQIGTESYQWCGNNDKSSLQSLWGRLAEMNQSSGLNRLLGKLPGEGRIALDIGCGNSKSAIDLLQKGWTVICLDYSQKALNVLEKRANEINEQWIKQKQLQIICCDAESYNWPQKVDLVVANSAIPYFNPLKIKEIMSCIYQNLNDNGYFIGNLFAAEYARDAMQGTKALGGWCIKDKDSVGYLLAGRGYEVIECDHGGQQNPHSVVFVTKRLPRAKLIA